ncbi:MAG: sodium:solute symporter family transporter [Bacteriovoracia bacterium]
MNFLFIDWFLIAAYIILVFYLAIKAGKKTKTGTHDEKEMAREQYLANKSLTFTESICSIIATEVSALTFLGIPAFAYNRDFTFIQIYMGAIVGRIIIAKVFLPKVYDKGLTIYEVMAQETGLPSGQRMVAIFYSLSKVLSVGVRLFSGSILVSHFLGFNVYVGLAIVTFVTFFYTLVGGLKAVVRTDILQMGLFISGGILAHYLIPQTNGQSWSELMGLAHSAGKTSFFSFENPWPFIFGILGGILFDMSTHGVDQDFAQRLTANRSLRHGQLAIFFSSFISISVGLLFLGVGALLWAHYQTHPFPEGVANADHLFSYFIVNHFPPGIRGIMVAGVLAATMSTLDSTINALCATLYNDILPHRESSKMAFYSALDTVVITLLLFGIAVVASTNDGLLMLGLKVQSWTGGALLGLFMTKVVFKKWFPYKLNTVNVIGAYAVGIGGVYLNQLLQWDWNLNVYWGCLLSMAFLKTYSMAKPMKQG